MPELVKTTLRLPGDLLKAAQIRAIQEDESFQDLVIKALRQYLKGGRK